VFCRCLAQRQEVFFTVNLRPNIDCNFNEIVIAQKQIWFGILLFPVFIMFFIFCLVETNRTPFDLPKAKAEFAAELVTG
jgi:NADH:ubiquinone oxidoreductase subunit H